MSNTALGQEKTPKGNAAEANAQSGGKNSGSSNPYAGSAADYQTRANRINQSTPFGATNYSQNPDGTWNQQTGFGAETGLGSAFNNYQAQVSANAATPMGTGEDARKQAVDAAYGQATSRLNPQWDQNSAQMESKLASQGLDPNSQAYRTAMDNLSQQKNDAYTSAMNGAIGQGTAAQQVTFNQNMSQRQFAMNQLGNMKSLLSMPGYGGAGDYASEQARQDQMKAEVMKGAMSVGSSVAAAGASASDERVKQNIERLPMEAAPGVPAARFEYKAKPGQKFLGVIAQDLEAAGYGDHVTEGPDGVKRVSEAFRPFNLGAKKR